MRIKIIRASLILAGLVSSFFVCPSDYGQQVIPAVKDETYNQVIDRLFPRELYTDQNAIYSLVIRFVPSFDLPEQLNITVFRDATIKVARLSIPETRPSAPRTGLRSRLDRKFAETGKEDAEVLAGFFNVDKVDVSAPSSDLKLLLAQLPQLEFPAKVGTKVVLDGTRYEIWFKSYTTSLYYSTAGAYLGRPPYRDPVVEWMNLVLDAAKKSEGVSH